MRKEEDKVCPPRDTVYINSTGNMANAPLNIHTAFTKAPDEAVPDGQLLVDTLGRILSCNRHFAQIWRMPQSIYETKNHTPILRYALRQVQKPRELIELVRRLFTTKISDLVKEVVALKDGRMIEISGQSVADDEGTLYGWTWHCRDITDQYQTREELQRQKNFYQNALEVISDAFITFDFDWKIIYANGKAATLGRFEQEDIIGKDLWEAIPGLDQTPLHELFRTCMITRQPGSLEYQLTDTHQWLRIKVHPSEREMSILATDISDTKRAEEGLRKSEGQYRIFANSLPQLAWMAHADGWIHWYNERWYAYTGTTLEEMKGWGWEKVHHPDHIERVVAFVKEAWKKDKPWELTFPLRRRDGVYRWFLTRAYPVKDESGVILYWTGTNTDIHDQLEAEKALKQSEAQLRQLADFMPQIVWSTDPQGNHDFYNKRWYEFTGLTFSQTKNSGWSQVLHPDDVGRTLKIWNHSLQTGELYEIEYRMKRNDGEYRWLLARAMPLRDASGTISRWFGTCTDIHDQRILADTLEIKVEERTRDLKEANAHLKRINEELRQFNYIASHDLQEPIRKIRIFSDRIRRQDYDSMHEPSRIALDRIMQSADHLSVLFKDLMDFIGIQREMMFTCVSLNDVISSVEKDLELIIWERKATIYRENLPTIKAIPSQMHQLFYNLISNALKFASADTAPRIRVTCTELSAPEIEHQELLPDQKYYHFVVEDNGIGFEQEFADRIFVLFKRLHSQNTFKGTGVGLALCKKVVENHFGRIWAESEPGQGASFHIILPAVAHR